MLAEIVSAATRAVLMALLVATPALVLPDVSADATQIVILLAFFAAAFVFIEYFATYPSIIEFRNAPPFNRLRYLAVLITVFALAAAFGFEQKPNALNGLMHSLTVLVGYLVDFPYSPVRLLLHAIPTETAAASGDVVRLAAGFAYAVSLISLIVFYVAVRLFDWPTRNGAFNVWVNLPLFDPTAGGDVLVRLTKDGRFNIAMGFLLPFMIPAFLKLLSGTMNLLDPAQPQTLIWTVTLWAFFPAGLMMRGIAMIRVAAMIDENRKRAYAAAQGLQPV